MRRTRPRSPSSAVTRYSNAQVVLRKEQGARIGLTVGVNNATDKLYRVAGNSSLTTGSGYAETAYARPRVYFATLNYDF